MTKNNPEFSESGGQNNFYESNYFNYRWVWTNTLSFSRTFNEIHSLNILLGTEAIRDGLGRSLNARRYNYLFEDNTNTYTLDMGENNSQRTNSSTYNGEFALFGMFARADYGYKDKYLLTGIIRRDGVSRFSKIIVTESFHLSRRLAYVRGGIYGTKPRLAGRLKDTSRLRRHG